MTWMLELSDREFKIDMINTWKDIAGVGGLEIWTICIHKWELLAKRQKYEKESDVAKMAK